MYPPQPSADKQCTCLCSLHFVKIRCTFNPPSKKSLKTFEEYLRMSPAFSFLTLLLLVLQGKAQETTTTTTLTSGINRFSTNLYRAIVDSSRGDDLIVSPFITSVALAMLAAGGRGQTTSELRDALGIAELTNQETETNFRELLDALAEKEDGYELELSNSMWVQEQAKVQESYKQEIKDAFDASAMAVDFGNKNATDAINHFVSKETRGKIETLFDEQLDPMTVMVLVNAMYFKGTWMTQFNKNDTEDRIFYNQGEQSNGKLVPTMTIQENFFYSKRNSLGAKVLEMPYKGKNVSMFFVLPRRNATLESVEKQLTSANIANVTENMQRKSVRVQLPKFKLDSSIPLENPLKSIAINTIFSAKADFSGISMVDDLYVSDIKQRAVISIDEEGSEVAVAEGTVLTAKSLSRGYELFKADRPFMFFLQHKPSGAILCFGRVFQL